MNKDDILAKSRAENQGSDEYEKMVLEKAGRLAAQVGLLACCVVATVSVAVTEKVNYACWIIYFSTYSTIFWVKYHHIRKKHELMLAVVSAAMFLLFSGLFINDLIHWN